MKNLLLIFLFAVFNIHCYAQVSFEKGYYINNNDQKIDCYIKNLDWQNNPKKFEFRLSEGSETEVATIKTVKEFGIDEVSKYIRAQVKIDRSTDNRDNLSKIKEPVYQDEEVFLMVLLEGQASLYIYKDRNLSRFFYKKDEGLEQLVFKYYMNADEKIAENNGFKHQLWNNLACSTISIEMIDHLYYEKKDMLRFFEQYNECSNQEVTNYDKLQKKDLFNLNLRPGLNFSQLTVDEYRTTDEVVFDTEMTFRFGIEAEFILPFRKNKWAVITEPTYQYYKTEKELEEDEIATVDYSAIELPLGIRYYIFLNDQSKIFMNASLIYDIVLNASIEYEFRKLDIVSDMNMGFGAGYKYNNKYSLEFRYYTPRHLTEKKTKIETDYNTFSMIFGYTLF